MGFSSMTAFPQKARFDLNVAKKEIQLQINAFVEALRKSDTIALGNLYTSDAKILNHGSPSIIGRPAIIKDYGETVRSGMTVFNATITGLWGDNNLLVEESTGYFAYTNGKIAGKVTFLAWHLRRPGPLSSEGHGAPGRRSGTSLFAARGRPWSQLPPAVTDRTDPPIVER